MAAGTCGKVRMETARRRQGGDGRIYRQVRSKNGLCMAAYPKGGEPWHKDRNMLLECGDPVAECFGWPWPFDRRRTREYPGSRLPPAICPICAIRACATREPCHMPRATEFNRCERERPSRLCVLINPILPGAIHRDHAGEILENLALAARNNPGSSRAAHTTEPFPDDV